VLRDLEKQINYFLPKIPGKILKKGGFSLYLRV
jgi:hypothetical protein